MLFQDGGQVALGHVIGKGAVIGGNVFITASVPSFNRVSTEPAKLRYQDRSKGYVDDWTI